jgi:hypothetical protein
LKRKHFVTHNSYFTSSSSSIALENFYYCFESIIELRRGEE